MELYAYPGTPPEKYYEACVTYHLVRRFEWMYGRRLYPFSVSQIREKKLGFDFGYELSEGNLFLVQFKRPYVMGNGRLRWQIGREQAEILAKQPVKAYYAFPAFLDGKEWYEGLEKTVFVPAGIVYTWVRGRKAGQTAWLEEGERMLSVHRSNFSDMFGRNLKNVLRAEPEYAAEDFLEQMNGAMEDQICGYRMGEGTEHGTWQLFECVWREDLSERSPKRGDQQDVRHGPARSGPCLADGDNDAGNT